MEVVSSGPLPVASIAWQTRSGGASLTVVCRATFVLRPGESPLADEQDPPCPVDVHWNDEPWESLRAASDLVPFKRRPEVLVVGHAYAPRGEPVRSLVARLGVGEIDKSIEVHADRAFGVDGQLREGPRFVKAPLLWLHAAGGPGTANPVGVWPDAPPDRYGQRILPRFQPLGLHLTGPGDHIPIIGFGPIAPTWPERWSKLGPHANGWDHDRWFERPLPDDLDPAYFNAAPADQQLDDLRADERILLENLHPTHPRLVTNLVAIPPVAVVEQPGRRRAEVPFACDTLGIDADRGVATLTFRLTVPIEAPGAPGRVTVRSLQPDRETTKEYQRPREETKEYHRPREETKEYHRPRERTKEYEVPREETRSFQIGQGGDAALPFVRPPQATLPFTARAHPPSEAPAAMSGLPFRAPGPGAPPSPSTPPGAPPLGGLPFAVAMPAPRPAAGPVVVPRPPAAPRFDVDDEPTTDAFLDPTPATRWDPPHPSPRSVPPAPIPLSMAPAPAPAPLAPPPPLPVPPPLSMAPPLSIAPAPPLPVPPPLSMAPPPLSIAPAPPLPIPPPPLSLAPLTPPPPAPPAPLPLAPIQPLPPPPPLLHPAEPAASAEPPPVAAEPPLPDLPPPPPPRGLPLDAFPLARCAALAAAQARRPAQAAAILREHELPADVWAQLDEHWAEAIRKETDRGRSTQRNAYDKAYVARLEEERGPITPEEYARLTFALERGHAEATLGELGLPPGAILRIQRVFLDRMAADPAFGRSVRAALATDDEE
jgi:hypothetical protein